MAKRQPKTKRSNSRDPELRHVIAWRINEGRLAAYPHRGGLKTCAEEFGVAPQQWSQYESGNRTPEDQNLERIAKHLKTSVQHLMTPPENWESVKEEWLAARTKAKRKPPKNNPPTTVVEQVRASFQSASNQASPTNENAIPEAGMKQRNVGSALSGSQNPHTLELIQKIIIADRLSAEGKISAEDISSTFKSVDVLIEALCRESAR